MTASNRGLKNLKSGEAAWGRDVHHASVDTGKPLYHGARTLCGVPAEDWLVIGDEPHLAESPHLRRRCAALISKGAPDA
jgi:hypothetical protein